MKKEPQCSNINSFHGFVNSGKRTGKETTLPIIVEDGCWIGAHTTIMPGVTIAKGCIIGANSLVTTVPSQMDFILVSQLNE